MISDILTKEFKLQPQHVSNIISLIDEGNTIPFIARYRKELTGHLDDQILREFSDRLSYLKSLEKRKEEVTAAITEQEKMTDEIAKKLGEAKTLTEVEDIYRPFKQKKKTRASVAIGKGLQPLADIFMAQNLLSGNIDDIASPYINEEKGVKTVKEAIDGAVDIVAEMVSDNAELRKKLRNVMRLNGEVVSKMSNKTKEDSKIFEMYGDFAEEVNKIPPHRILAINRGESEEILKVKVDLNRELAVRITTSVFVKPQSITKDLVIRACEDSYDRLIQPSIEREIRAELTENANEQAIKMFEVNLRPLLLQPPIKDKVTLGLDPAYRTGCKIAVVDSMGKVLATTVIYPTPPQSKVEESKQVLKELIKKYKVDIISMGNGTASKESEIFVADLIKELDRKVSYMIVNEAGASVYSASKLAAEEFPEFDVSLRSAVSIARRLQDPLAELIKIDPKAIGVGQYQHDMPQARLSTVLCGVLEDCVNSVGVDLNTASVSLLTYVAGLNSAIAKNIIQYRESTGRFTSRKQLLDINKLGPKAFLQCAGFLRITEGENILDSTAVHPESYDAANKLLKIFGYSQQDVKDKKICILPLQIKEAGEEKIAGQCGIGIPTLNDIVAELLKPGRDIRDSLPQPILRSDIMDINDLAEGMELTGTVRNVIDFGVFVDIGVHQDGLVHISEISDKFIRHPSEAVKVGDIVKVRIIGIDKVKHRISLTMKNIKKQ